MNIYELSAEEFDGEEWFRGLTTRQALFVQEYLVDFNGTGAARRAGYRGNQATLYSKGSANLANPKILRALKRAIKEIGVPPPLLGMKLRKRMQDNLVEFYYLDPLDPETLE